MYANSLFRAGVRIQINLFSGPAAHPVEYGLVPGGLANASISVPVRNNGNTAPQSHFEITFYSNESLTQTIGTTVIGPPVGVFPGMTGCATKSLSAEVIWEGLPSGLHQYWALIDSGDLITETDKSDNVTSGFVLIDPEQLFVPTVFRG